MELWTVEQAIRSVQVDVWFCSKFVKSLDYKLYLIVDHTLIPNLLSLKYSHFDLEAGLHLQSGSWGIKSWVK